MNSEFDYIKFYTDILKKLLQHNVGIFIILCVIYYLVFGVFFYKKIKNKLYAIKINREPLLYVLHGTTAIFLIGCYSIWISGSNIIPIFPVLALLLLTEFVSIRSSNDDIIFFNVLNNSTISFTLILHLICNIFHFEISLFPTVALVSLIEITLIMLSDSRFTNAKMDSNDAILVASAKGTTIGINVLILVEICPAFN